MNLSIWFNFVWRYLWVDGWVNGWPHVKSLKSNKSWPNRDNSIMDILDIFWTFCLNHLSPLWGYFFMQQWRFTYLSFGVEFCSFLLSQYLLIYQSQHPVYTFTPSFIPNISFQNVSIQKYHIESLLVRLNNL